MEIRSDLPQVLLSGLLCGIPGLLLVSWLALRAGDRLISRVFAGMVLILSLLPGFLGIVGAMDALPGGLPSIDDLALMLLERSEWVYLVGEAVLCSILAWAILRRLDARRLEGPRPFLAGRRVSSRSSGGGSAPRG